MTDGRSPPDPHAPLLKVRDLSKRFHLPGGGLFGRIPRVVHAVDKASFTLNSGETLGIVGESGCGKTTLSRAVIRLTEPSSGSVHFRGRDLLAMSEAELRRERRDMQIVFQDPFGSLNPRMTVRDVVDEPLRVHSGQPSAQRLERIAETLDMVGLGRDALERYPHEFSGGQRQRISIARAMVLDPALLIGDEPVSALDVSVRAQILNLLRRLQERTNVGYLIVSHDLGAIRYICDRVVVMYLGRIVEEGPVDAVIRTPLHPYTQVLVSAVPVPRAGGRRARIVLGGEVPSPLTPPPGCHFHTRCPLAKPVCREIAPPLRDLGGGRKTACHLIEAGADPGHAARLVPAGGPAKAETAPHSAAITTPARGDAQTSITGRSPL